MGEAKRRKRLGDGAPRVSPGKVRRVDLDLPSELAEKLDKLRPAQWAFREWLVGALGAFAEWAEQEQERKKTEGNLVQPYRTMPPKLPAGSLLGGRA